MRFYIIILASFLFAMANGARAQDNMPSLPKESAYELPRLSPRPASISEVQHPVMSLNGVWKFTGGKAVNKNIRVPGEWEMQGFKVDSAAMAKYSRYFNIPADWKGKRIKLRFDAVSSHCIVRVNGKIVGGHEGSFVPFEYDITKEIVPGRNFLEVDVQCQTISDILACTSQYAGHPVGGILRKVDLFALPDINIASLAYVTKFDNRYKNATLQIPLEIINEGKKAANAAMLFELRDASGRRILLPGYKFSVPPINSGALKKDTVALQVKQPEQWNPEHPYRYMLITKLLVDGKVTETHEQKIGFRQVEIRGNQLFVNNHPVKLHGVCRHSIYPFTGRSVSPELCVKDAVLFRNGNCNYIRTSHYPPEEEFLDACDSLGLFVESESSLCWIDHGASPIWQIWNYLDQKFLPYMVNANLEKMAADRNHPSVIIWSLGNESRWSPLWAKVNEIVKQVDPSRPTAFQDQCWGSYNNAGSRCDIANYHYPGFNGPAACDTMSRPTQFDEYAHVENYNRREVLTDPFVRADWGPSLERMYDSMYAHKACLGGAIWAGIDDIFHMPDGRIIGYGPWGVIDGWRREKPEYFAMKKAYAPVIVKNINSPEWQDGPIILQVENRYDFTNLSALTIICRTGNNSFRVIASVPTHHAGVITIPLPKKIKSDSLLLIFKDPRGFVCQEELLHLGHPMNENNQHEKAPAHPVELVSSPDGYVIHTGDIIYTVNKKTGMIEKATVDKRTVLLPSPALMIVPLNNDDGGAPGTAGCNYQENIRPLMYKPCADWRAASVQAVKEENGTVQLTVTGTYREATGNIVTIFERDGSLRMAYHFTVSDSVKINPRQWGLVFSLPRGFDQLNWNRKGHWAIYPADDIAGNKGEAKAHAIHQPYVEPWEKLSGPWSNDANDLGSNDFRSTKANIYSAAVKDKTGAGVQVLSDGAQSVRTWIDGNHVWLLVADYNTGGSDGFSGFFYSKERRPLKGGDIVSGTVKIKLVKQADQ